MRPNYIQGMLLRIRKQKTREKHFKALDRKWLQFQALLKKKEREETQRSRANQPYQY